MLKVDSLPMFTTTAQKQNTTNQKLFKNRVFDALHFHTFLLLGLLKYIDISKVCELVSCII